MPNSIVLLKVPRAGLGNRFLVWAHAFVFATLNNLYLYETSWFGFNIGPFLRKERAKRFYVGMVHRKNNPFFLPRKLKKVKVPKSDWTKLSMLGDKLYVFNEMPHHQHYFDLICEYRKQLQLEFERKLLPRLENYVNPDDLSPIAIHIRLGDFTTMPWYKSPWDFYRKLIRDIRHHVGEEMPISVFSDGRPSEIPIIAEFNNIVFYTLNNDVLDLLALINSKMIVTYPGSTFSLWAAFMSNSYIVHTNGARINSSNNDKSLIELDAYSDEKNMNPKMIEVLQNLKRDFLTI